MSWPSAVVACIAILCCSALVAWVLWLIHDSEPITEEQP